MERYNKQLRENATLNLTYKVRGLNAQLLEAEDAYAAKKLSARLQNAQNAGAAMAAGADSGGGGNTLAAIGQTLSTNLARNLAQIQGNLAKTRANTASQKEFAHQQATAYINSNAQYEDMDWFGSILNAANTGLSVYSMAGGFKPQADGSSLLIAHK